MCSEVSIRILTLVWWRSLLHWCLKENLCQ